MSTCDQIAEKYKQKGLEEGMEKGIQKGIEQNQKDVVINAYKSGITPDLIANIVGMTSKEVEQILKESGQN